MVVGIYNPKSHIHRYCNRYWLHCINDFSNLPKVILIIAPEVLRVHLIKSIIILVVDFLELNHNKEK